MHLPVSPPGPFAKEGISTRETILEAIRAHAERAAERPCLIERGEVWTYAEYWRAILGFSRHLRSLGVGAGDIVVVKAKQAALFFAAAEAVRLAGAVFAPVEQNIGADRVRALVKMLGARALIADENIARCPIFERLDGVRAHAHRGELPSNVEFPDPDDVTDIQFTSGSTDLPKAVEIAAGAVAARARAHIEVVGDPPGAVELLALPLNHSFALSVYSSLMLKGATAVLSGGFMDLGQTFRLIGEHGVNGISLVPTGLSLILKCAEDRLAACAGKLRYLRMGGAKPIEGDVRRAKALLPGTAILNLYGATEASTVFCTELGGGAFDPTCVGRKVGELELRFVDAEGREVAAGREAPGYVALRSARNMRGYFGNPALTNRVLSADGFVRTCDLGYLDADGQLHLVGREGGVLSVGGFLVSLDELESTARAMDGVEDCACVAVDDDLLDQVPALFYAAAEGRDIQPQRLRAFLESKLERFKLPRRIERLERIPKLYNGKTDVRALRG